MSTDLQKPHSNLPATEATNIASEAEYDAGFQKMIKYKKGHYWRDGEEVKLGTQMIAHAIGWTKTWVHFENRQVVERKVYRVAKGERVPERDQLPDQDQSMWPPGLDGRPGDPWVLQYLLPMEDETSGDINIFVGSSFGGRRAVAELCSAYGRRAARNPNCGQPIITLETTTMPTRNFGDVDRPTFKIVSWDEGQREPVREFHQPNVSQDMDDEIPFDYGGEVR